MRRETATDQVMEVRTLLLQQCHLFDDPASYEAGVEDATAAFHEALTGTPLADHPPGDVAADRAGHGGAIG